MKLSDIEKMSKKEKLALLEAEMVKYQKEKNKKISSIWWKNLCNQQIDYDIACKFELVEIKEKN